MGDREEVGVGDPLAAVAHLLHPLDDRREFVLVDVDAVLGERGLDARSPGEYDGTTVRSARGGHIPGAVHYEWTRAMDRTRNLRLRPLAELTDELALQGITPGHEVVTYCHTHHRSAYSYAVLRILGYARVRGYPGSWSDWGNREDTPVGTTA